MRHVMFFGDSNTQGTAALARPGGLDRLPEADCGTSVATRALGDGWRAIAEGGHPGRTTVHPDPVEGGHKSGFAALPILLESHRPLDVVVILLGTNDLNHRFPLTPADIANGVDRLLDCIDRSNSGPEGAVPRSLGVAPVPVMETGMFVEMFQDGAAKSQRLAAALEAVATRRGVGFLDAGKVAEVDPIDGIHLDDGPRGDRARRGRETGRNARLGEQPC